MPTITLDGSPLIDDSRPAEIYYRDMGAGHPLLFLHGGWGYEVYPFDKQIEAFGNDFSILIPDRSGCGRSMRIKEFPVDFHQRAARETLRLLDALEVKRPLLWGHSDGAVIAAMMGLAAPERFSGLILEAFHFYKAKPSSQAFFETMASAPEQLGERVCRVLSREHGRDYWQELIVNNGRAWLEIARRSSHLQDDLYDGRLSELRVPAIFIHGGRDPRTEPDELDAIRRQLPHSQIYVLDAAGHSPHSESAGYLECNQIAGGFLSKIKMATDNRTQNYE